MQASQAAGPAVLDLAVLDLAVLDLGCDSVHTPAMTTPQRLPASLTPLDRALGALLLELKPIEAKQAAQADAPGCAVAELPELGAWPPHDSALVDGWALRASDLVGASSYTPLPLLESPAWVEAGDRIPDG